VFCTCIVFFDHLHSSRRKRKNQNSPNNFTVVAIIITTIFLLLLGCLPQTWEDPNVEHPVMKCFGDDDPIDVVEIGGSALAMGSVKEVKALGVLAMIDDGELDWKVVAVATDDPLAEEYNDIDDVPAAVKDGIREWFRWYKTPDDKPLNSFGYDEKFLDVAETKKIIEETNDSWKKLKADGSEKLWLN
jgi:inorganic pyrophosphatase